MRWCDVYSGGRHIIIYWTRIASARVLGEARGVGFIYRGGAFGRTLKNGVAASPCCDCWHKAKSVCSIVMDLNMFFETISTEGRVMEKDPGGGGYYVSTARLFPLRYLSKHTSHTCVSANLKINLVARVNIRLILGLKCLRSSTSHET